MRPTICVHLNAPTLVAIARPTARAETSPRCCGNRAMAGMLDLAAVGRHRDGCREAGGGARRWFELRILAQLRAHDEATTTTTRWRALGGTHSEPLSCFSFSCTPLRGEAIALPLCSVPLPPAAERLTWCSSARGPRSPWTSAWRRTTSSAVTWRSRLVSRSAAPRIWMRRRA